VKTTTAMTSGSHAPLAILVRFAARNSASKPRTAPPTGTTTHSGHPHCRQATQKARSVVMRIVPVTAIVTAIPKA
jgi:hypothetical protein